MAEAQLISLGLTTFLYGIFFTLFLVTTAVMTYNVKEGIRKQRMKILPVSFAMLLVATLHLVVVWIRGEYGFINERRGSVGAFYEDIAARTSLLRLTCLCVQSAIGDGVVIWRMYIIYGRRIGTIIPAILLVAAYTVFACVILHIIANSPSAVDVAHLARPWITAYFSLLMITNVLCSGAIAWRIFIVGRPLQSKIRVWPIVLAIVESSALYAISVTTALLTFLSNSNGQYPAVDSIVPLVGIVFSLIVLQIRFHAKISVRGQSDVQSSDSRARAHPVVHPAADGDLDYHMRSIQVSLHVPGKTDTQLNPGDTDDHPNDFTSDLEKDIA
ncbi:hypothetical protein BJV74DRAFT_887543 [Russula compacta]|nr:hypothetical protein BJV74DRAFT_887543 [Russula compacta]